LARAAYADADVFIFDDPLSALDPEVAEKVFDECILGMLIGKTRLLVTNQLQCLSRCDSIIALGNGGRVLEQGTFIDLNNSNGEVTRLLKGVAPSRRNIKEDQSFDRASVRNHLKETKKLISNEERQTGTVKLGVYLKYIESGGGWVSSSLSKPPSLHSLLLLVLNILPLNALF
jgi:ABC-type multidrug transport system ATPase subunit